jgi:hypothetical protein
MAKVIRACHAAMRKRLPTANELVYDNYHFFVFGYGPTVRPSDCVVSLAANSKGVNLNFLYGSELADPHQLLQGAGGKTVLCVWREHPPLTNRKRGSCSTLQRHKPIRRFPNRAAGS